MDNTNFKKHSLSNGSTLELASGITKDTLKLQSMICNLLSQNPQIINNETMMALYLLGSEELINQVVKYLSTSLFNGFGVTDKTLYEEEFIGVLPEILLIVLSSLPLFKNLKNEKKNIISTSQNPQ